MVFTARPIRGASHMPRLFVPRGRAGGGEIRRPSLRVRQAPSKLGPNLAGATGLEPVIRRPKPRALPLGYAPKFKDRTPEKSSSLAFRVPGPFIVPAVPWMVTLAGLILRVRLVRFRLLPPWPLLAPVGGCSGLRRRPGWAWREEEAGPGATPAAAIYRDPATDCREEFDFTVHVCVSAFHAANLPLSPFPTRFSMIRPVGRVVVDPRIYLFDLPCKPKSKSF